ncbi:O-antigen ligase family protein [Sphingomonas sp. ST-64]|uniref:O-antigen ligase family protein n=1 Tax=Sphingomonas plantiphila TaxID=3163295 RepID=A0ABW8YIN8_9SPHN
MFAFYPPRTLHSVRLLVVFWALLGVWMALQLIPLPASLWTALPGRAKFANVYAFAGIEIPAHAVSFAPDRTLSSLLTMLAPGIILFGLAGSESRQREQLVPIFALLAAVGAFLGAVQLAAGEASPLYFHQYANRASPIGFFANRNHQAVFLVMTLPLLRCWVEMPISDSRRAFARNAIAAIFALLIAVIALVSGSRAGLILLCLAIALSAFGGRTRKRTGRFGVSLLVSVVTLTLAAAGALAMYLGRAQSIDRAFELELAQEQRVTSLPTLLEMIRDMFPFGSGFGTFDQLFRSYEPDSALSATYLNNAHNDLIELAITGGAPALLILFSFLAWWGWAAIRAFRASPTTPQLLIARASASALLILLLASLADYPLRTPFLAALFMTLCVLLQFGVGNVRNAGASVATPVR